MLLIRCSSQAETLSDTQHWPVTLYRKRALCEFKSLG